LPPLGVFTPRLFSSSAAAVGFKVDTSAKTLAKLRARSSASLCSRLLDLGWSVIGEKPYAHPRPLTLWRTCSKSGSLAMFDAIGRASSWVNRLRR
jgi:hypothetical protein